MARFIHDGDTIDYTPAADVAAGDVVLEVDLVGVAKVDIPAGTLGALAVRGVYDFPKATGGGSGISMGDKVFWHDGNQQVQKSGTGGAKEMGKCVREAADGDDIVRVRLSP